MSITTCQGKEFKKSSGVGFSALSIPEPQSAIEWADNNYYSPKESSYQEGRWETLYFQKAIMNAMAHKQVREVNFIKSARVGYSKMLLAVADYLIEHKKRNGLLFQPTDGDASNFMKAHVEPAIRDVPLMKAIAPWLGKKHKDNTLLYKRFANGKVLWVLGGKAAKNYREKSVDFVVYDELAAFDDDVEKEGSPTFLGDKRIEGSFFPKSIRGSTPKIAGQCQIERAASESPHLMRLHIQCPHCNKLQALKWGGKDCSYGIKWDGSNPKTVFYCCEHNGCVIRQHEIDYSVHKWICEKTGIHTVNGSDWFNSDHEITPPESVTFHVWTAYNPLTTWSRIVTDFLKAKGDPGKLKTFVNTTLGETWDDDQGEKLDWQNLLIRRESFSTNPIPNPVVYITGGIDTQDDRYEAYVYGWGHEEESWLIDRWDLHGDPAGKSLLTKVSEKINKQYRRADGLIMRVDRWCWDSGGHYTDEVYSQSRKHGRHWVIPIKGASQYGKPIASFPRKPNAKKVYLTEVGTDNAKDIIYSRLKIPPKAGAIPGFVHLPANDEICGESELKQLTSEKKKLEIRKGRKVYRWDAGGRRNEALDCTVYALAALRISQQRFGVDLNKLQEGIVYQGADFDDSELQEEPEQTEQIETQINKPVADNWLKVDRGSPWL